MADLHSTPDTDETGTERSLIVGYRPKVHDKSTPNIILSGKWLRAAGFETGNQVMVKVMKGCIVVVAYNEQEQRLQDDYKRTKAKLVEIENALAAIQTPHVGKRLAKSNTNHLA
ncbi:SymE family type I addiction module toxin [Enterobacter soli]|uniref:SymE family type I addiction module toxin n=1 Tax=Enterobacter soli TaxID=885040 RepID=UPI002147A950|nr:SymE family type I addiction module toxin [Enterobacter soli]MCR1315979.1 SymE family type I addiction module toxin [Enterobacter soli]HDR2471654.1 SymE family type I addiction module toxin [Enterobacter soli]